MARIQAMGRPYDESDAEEFPAAALYLAQGIALLLTGSAAFNRTTVPAATASTRLIVANDDRLVVTIHNKGTTPLHITQPASQFGGAPADLEPVVAPGKYWQSANGVVADIWGWWDRDTGGAAPAGNAVVTEIVPVSPAAGGGGGGGATSLSSGPGTASGNPLYVDVSAGPGASSGNPLYVAGASITIPQATSNATWAAGAAAGAIQSSPGHLYSVTVTAPGSAALALTDGPGGPEIAYVPTNFPGGDIPLYVPKRFLTSLYAAGGVGTPAISVGVSS